MKLVSGKLKQFGYGTSKGPVKRHQALKEAVKTDGFESTVKRLNAVKTLTKTKNPIASNVYDSDIKYLERNKAKM